VDARTEWNGDGASIMEVPDKPGISGEAFAAEVKVLTDAVEPPTHTIELGRDHELVPGVKDAHTGEPRITPDVRSPKALWGVVNHRQSGLESDPAFGNTR